MIHPFFCGRLDRPSLAWQALICIPANYPQKKGSIKESSGEHGRPFLGYFFMAVDKEVTCPQAAELTKTSEDKRAKSHADKIYTKLFESENDKTATQ